MPSAIARARAQLPSVDLPLTQRNAQLVIAREYGYAGWQDLIAEVSKRSATVWSGRQRRLDRVIHDNDVERLKQLLAEYPALLSWHGDEDTAACWDSPRAPSATPSTRERERNFTRAECAELLIDAGAVVMPSVCDGLSSPRQGAAAAVSAQRPASAHAQVPGGARRSRCRSRVSR